jgi:hypothetical protein
VPIRENPWFPIERKAMILTIDNQTGSGPVDYSAAL